MPNALRKSRAGKKRVAKVPTDEYSTDGTNTNGEAEVSNMSDDSNFEDTDGGGGVDTMEREDAPTLPDFASMVEDAPEDYQPQRTSAGRKRIPSPFDTLIVDAKGQGWKRVPHGGDEEAIAQIKRQLQKAQHFAGLGMDLSVNATHVEFKVREKQTRTRKSSTNGQTALDVSGGEQDENDRDE